MMVVPRRSHILGSFRRPFYDCLHRRADAFFELDDAIHIADGAASSPAHLSLQASYLLGWDNLYAPLARGGTDAEALQTLLSRHSLASISGDEPSVYMVDASV